MFSIETLNAKDSETGKAAALTLACLVLNNVIGKLCANLIISLLKKRGYVAAEGLRDYLFMACAAIISAPIVEESANKLLPSAQKVQEVPHSEDFYKKVQDISKKASELRNSKLIGGGIYIAPLAAGALGVGAYSLLRRKRGEQD